MNQYTAKTAEETLSIGENIGKSVKQGDVIALIGDLGAGKTVLAKGIAKGLGIQEDVTSPTFTLLRQYRGRLSFNHYDLYRIEDEQELFHIGFYDDLGGNNVCVIEWPEIASELHATIIVKIAGSGSEPRHIEITENEETHDYSGG